MKILKPTLCVLLVLGFTILALKNFAIQEWSDAAMCLVGAVVSYLTGLAAFAANAKSTVK